ncbi:MAG: HXXEE domain-containing protein [Treponema sp.]|nr:HXXEE domain-containing protein [Treponema sp.]
MKDFILLLPIIFIFHDMEELVGFGCFFRKNPWLYERFPKVMKNYKGFTNEGFALGVYEEFIPFFGVSLLAFYFPGKILYALWFGIFISLLAHFFIHIGHSIYIRKYIPCLITSVICLPVSILILAKCAKFMVFDLVTISFIAVGILMMILNMKLIYSLFPIVNAFFRKSYGEGWDEN